MIRQAISCDICGTEMQHAHHWFVAYDRGSELRVSGWNARARMRGGARHLCGQKCLHKLVDDFMARTLAADSEPALTEKRKADLKEVAHSASRVDDNTSALASPSVAVRVGSSYRFEEDCESSARLVTPAESSKHQTSEMARELPSYASRAWRSQAWKREQEREQREASSSAGTRRRSIA